MDVNSALATTTCGGLEDTCAHVCELMLTTVAMMNVCGSPLVESPPMSEAQLAIASAAAARKPISDVDVGASDCEWVGLATISRWDVIVVLLDLLVCVGCVTTDSAGTAEVEEAIWVTVVTGSIVTPASLDMRVSACGRSQTPSGWIIHPVVSTQSWPMKSVDGREEHWTIVISDCQASKQAAGKALHPVVESHVVSEIGRCWDVSITIVSRKVLDGVLGTISILASVIQVLVSKWLHGEERPRTSD